MSEIGKPCAQSIERLHPFLDGELTDEQLTQLKAHLDTCVHCAALFDSHKKIHETCRELDADISPPPEFRAGWRRKLRKAALARRYRAWARAGAAVAAALAIWVGGTALLRNGVDLSGGVEMPANMPAPMYGEADMDYYDDYEAVYDEDAVAGSGKGVGIMSRGLSFSDEMYDSEPDTMADMYETIDEQFYSEPEIDAVIPQGIVILRSASLDMETTDFDGVAADLAELITQYNGFEELREVRGRPFDEYNTRVGRSAQISARVPEGALDAFLIDAGALGDVTYSQSRAQDISRQYADVQQRLKTSVAQRDRLRELMTQAEDITDIITIEDKLTSLQSEIEWMQGTVREWDGLRDMARVELSLREVQAKTVILPLSKPLGERVSEGFFASLNALRNFAADMLIALVWALPQLVIWVPLLTLAGLLARFIHKKRQKARR